MKPDFKPRLLRAMSKGDLVPGDLAHWFDRSHPTVRYWVYRAKDDYDPLTHAGGGVKKGPKMLRRLKLLEWAINHKIGFPVPADISQRDRPGHLRKTLHAVDARVPDSHLT